jgi:hypothetical protein
MWMMAGLGLLTSGLLLYSWYRRIVLKKLKRHEQQHRATR